MDESQFHIRKCGLGDMDIMVEMRVEFLKEAGHVKDEGNIDQLCSDLRCFIEAHLNRDFYIWVVEAGQKAVATGAACIWHKLPLHPGEAAGSKFGYVQNMYTRPGFRKKGLASRIIKDIIEFLRDEGIPKALLHALEDGKGVYGKTGFAANESFMEMKL